jgi:hypothetical protein
VKVIDCVAVGVLLIASGCATDASTRAAAHASAARTHDAFAEDFRNAGNNEAARAHAEKAEKEREQAAEAECFLCSLFD